MRKRLSVVIITKNEEEKIPRCLESIRWADEVIVVDGYSTDRTVEICKKFCAKVIQHRFEGDFGLERNIGTDAASGDWILQLDGDDVVTLKLKDRIEQILLSDSPYVAYRFRRKNYFLGHFMRYGGWYHYYTHLYKKGLEKEGILDSKIIRYNLTARPIKLFWKMYVKKMGFREGVYGLFFSVLYALVHFVKWAKYWEKVKQKKE